MSNTYSNLLFHVVFSVKERRKLLHKELRDRLYPYLAGIAKQNNFKVLASGATDDHVHILMSIMPSVSVSKAVQLLKGGSSKWIHDEFLDLRIFSWQEGYAVFSVSLSQTRSVKTYIANQEFHHKKFTLKRNTYNF